MRTLRVTSGPLSGHSVEVERELIIGRVAADLTIPDAELSRRHAVVRPVDGGVVIEDLSSLNGTFLGDERIGDPVTLTRDATIRVGRSLIAVELDLPGLPEAPPPAAPDGRTRVAAAVPASPASPAAVPASPVAAPAPPVTAVRPAAAALDEAPSPPPPSSPAVTRVRPVPVEAAVPGPQRPLVAPAVTRVRPVPALDEAPPEPADDAAPEPARGLRLRLRGLLRRGPRR
jgi:predicted component of type VI protein secretion system